MPAWHCTYVVVTNFFIITSSNVELILQRLVPNLLEAARVKICPLAGLAIMSPPGKIDSVFRLAAIPRPLDSQHGHIFTSTVCSLTKSKKRKRFEVAASIDGESINIYNVCSPSTLYCVVSFEGEANGLTDPNSPPNYILCRTASNAIHFPALFSLQAEESRPFRLP